MKPYLLALALAVVLTTGTAIAADPPAPPAQPASRPVRPAPKDISGTIKQFNLGPRGSAEGIILTADGKTVQLNMAPDLASQVNGKIAVGDAIKASVVPEMPPRPPMGGPSGGPSGSGSSPAGKAGRAPGGGATDGDKQTQTQSDGPNDPPPPPPDNAGLPNASGDNNDPPPPPPETKPDHDVYHVLQITDAKGNTYGSLDNKPKTTHVDGTIKTLNYDRMGNVNGAVLDNGTFVQVPPPSAKQLNLKVGDKISADGIADPSGNALHANSINGTATQGPPPGGPGGPAGQNQQGGNNQNQQQGGPGGRGPGGPPSQGQNNQSQRQPGGAKPPQR